MTFKERLASLGFPTYNDYLNSDHWKMVKEKWRASGRPMRCEVCGRGAFNCTTTITLA